MNTRNISKVTLCNSFTNMHMVSSKVIKDGKRSRKLSSESSDSDTTIRKNVKKEEIKLETPVKRSSSKGDIHIRYYKGAKINRAYRLQLRKPGAAVAGRHGEPHQEKRRRYFNSLLTQLAPPVTGFLPVLRTSSGKRARVLSSDESSDESNNCCTSENKDADNRKQTDLKKQKISISAKAENDSNSDAVNDKKILEKGKNNLVFAILSELHQVPYSALARTLEGIEQISARLKIIQILSNYFRSVIVLTPEDLLPSVYLCLNKLAPAYEGLELGIAETNLMKAIAQSTGRNMAQIKADVQEVGDLGVEAEKSKSNQRMTM
ncbi:hypothetical protein NQ317_002583 [Molorchus minor]|uniref:DNA ligase ATP-dependent N-terminal domain-containing protein n=1 Tax=Molorchus minor TaxID=1323400 RepID=A0ABQ9JU09_9CUCU|nr:hypothetical protein NQ317_002583 [Molorchus minor]